MGTLKSKPSVDSKNGRSKDKERIEELEHRIFKLQALLGKFVIAMDQLHELQQGKFCYAKYVKYLSPGNGWFVQSQIIST